MLNYSYNILAIVNKETNNDTTNKYRKNFT
ncbi:hypothetical protein DSL99_3595 [Leeuwenhoekiella marinoflava]|uniref:Uncharacterized protein n=1 Tax=Leeuwenhoekiella marinoflava TaxID=988 RepID=A0A4Q0PDT5_9FLAO|nr:hypothetical protein DSL99_3595 [Leeuwenhoekiella marinoflava]